MIPEIIAKWDVNKNKLEDYFTTNRQGEYDSYGKIVKKLFELVINQDDDKYDHDNILEIDDGHYQGTVIFIIHKDEYQPDITDYLVTHNYYGSCSGCDTLQAICEYNYNELPTQEQVKEYMALALHLVQKMKVLGSDD